MYRKRRRFWYYIRSYRYRSLITKHFIMIFIFFILPMTGMGLLVYYNMNQIVEREVSNISMDSLRNTKDTIETVLRDADIIATQISIQPSVKVFLMSNLSPAGWVDIYNDAFYTIKTFPIVQRHIDTIYIYSSINNFVISSRDSATLTNFRDKSWFDTYNHHESNLPWIHARVKGIYPYYISVVRPAYLYDDEKLGAVIINIDAEKLGSMIGENNDQALNDFLIIDEAGTVIFSYSLELITKHISDVPLFNQLKLEDSKGSPIAIINDEKYIVSSELSSVNNLRYISLISLSNYSERVEWVQRFIITFFITSIVLAFMIAIFLSYKSFQPISNIIHLLEAPEDWKYPKKGRGMNELKYIANNIVKMVSSNSQLQHELENRMTLLDKAHTSALQAQINPHFLYNSLESINWLAALSMGKKNKVSEMITNLSRLLRLSLESDEEVTTLSKEIEHAQCYIEIMKIRYEDKFDVIWDIPETLLTCKIIKLCLQPVIENAVDHGLKRVRKKGIIKVVGRMQADHMVIEIHDNGVGLTEDKVRSINATLEKDYVLKAEHIGLNNIAQRIKLVFGEEYGIILRKADTTGLIACITIPCMR